MKQRNSNDALFRLIKSMSAGEKRFFHLMCSRQSSANGKSYLQLFNAIDKQEQNDESKIKELFNKEGVHFIETKRYLYKQVLDTLVQHFRGRNEKNAYNTLLELDVLYEKGLYDQHELLLGKLRKTAEEKEDFLVLMDVVKREKRYHNLRFKYTDIKKMRKLRELEDLYAAQHKEVEEYRELSNEIIYYHNEQRFIGSKAFMQIKDRPLFKDLEKPASLTAKLILYNLRAIYFSTLSFPEVAKVEYAQAVRILQSNPEYSNSNPAYASSTYMNYIANCVNLAEYEVALKGVVAYKKFLLNFPELTKHKIILLLAYEFNVYRETGKKNEAIELLSQIENKMDSGEAMAEIGNKFYLYFQAGYAFLEFGDNHSSIKWLNKILNYPAAEKLSFLYYYNARILQLLNLIDIKDEELLRYRIKSFQRLMLKRKRVSDADKMLIDFFSKVLKEKLLTDRKGLSHQMKELKKSLKISVDSPTENEVLLSVPDISSWLELVIKRIGD